MIMVNKFMIMNLTLVTGLLLLLCPMVTAADAISTIHAGNTVFIGEQGLDITPAMEGDTILGWWASGAAISSSSPDYTIIVSNPSGFSVYPGDFGTHTGNWYHMSSLNTANGTAFTVADPYLDLKVEDTTVGVDVTNKWVSTDDELQFRIDTNLFQIAQRTGVSSVPVTIKVQSPDGAILTSLINKAGTTTSLVDYPITTTPKYTGSIWDTSRRTTYLPGTYSIWAECNVNSMKDNYGQAGKSISSKVSLLNQDRNPLIGNSGYVTNPTTAVTTVTTKITTIATTNPVATPSTVATTIPVTTAGGTITTESPATVTTLPEPTATPMKSPGFGMALAVISTLCAMALFLKRK